MASLLEDVHKSLELPDSSEKLSLVRGSYKYYHYLCDGVDDRGWGCGYRTLQTLCSWLRMQLLKIQKKEVKNVPTLLEIQECLVAIGDKPQDFIGSRQWIGSVEVSMCINHFYEVLSKIIHVPSGDMLINHVHDIETHFRDFGSPIMMGGDRDASSKGILGICRASDAVYLLVLDPHFVGDSISVDKMKSGDWIKWQKLESFLDSSFYNMCLPQYKAVSIDN